MNQNASTETGGRLGNQGRDGQVEVDAVRARDGSGHARDGSGHVGRSRHSRPGVQSLASTAWVPYSKGDRSPSVLSQQ